MDVDLNFPICLGTTQCRSALLIFSQISYAHAGGHPG